jgi:cardiolipin synthase (CMP-forming)
MKPTFNLANFITLGRIFCLPFMVIIYELPQINMVSKAWALSIVFIVLALSDWLDGFLARRLNMQSAFGAFLDPVADKIMIIVSLLIILDAKLIPYWVALIIILRELIISALREWMAQIGSHQKVSVRYIGKLKTATQMCAIPMFFFAPIILKHKPNHYHLWTYIADGAMYVSIFLTVWSMLIYLKDACSCHTS